MRVFLPTHSRTVAQCEDKEPTEHSTVVVFFLLVIFVLLYNVKIPLFSINNVFLFCFFKCFFQPLFSAPCEQTPSVYSTLFGQMEV